MFHTKEIHGGGDSTGGQEVGGSHYHVHLVGDVDTPTQDNLQRDKGLFPRRGNYSKVYQTSTESFHSPYSHIVDEGHDISLSPCN